LLVYNRLAATNNAADVMSSTGQILNQITGVRAPVSAVNSSKRPSEPVRVLQVLLALLITDLVRV
jgi:hypothetical protein